MTRTTIIIALIAIACLAWAVHWLLRYDAADALIKFQEKQIAYLAEERDSLDRAADARDDSIDALRATRALLTSEASNLRENLRGAIRRANISIQPDFNYALPDSQLLACVRDALRERLRAAGRACADSSDVDWSIHVPGR